MLLPWGQRLGSGCMQRPLHILILRVKLFWWMRGMAIYNLKLCTCRRIERRAARQPARGVRRAGRRAMIGWERGPRGRSTTSSRRRPHCQLTSPARRSRQTGPSGEGRPGERAAAVATAPKGRTVGRAPCARTAMSATAQMTVQVLQHAPSLLLGRLIQLVLL